MSKGEHGRILIVGKRPDGQRKNDEEGSQRDSFECGATVKKRNGDENTGKKNKTRRERHM